MIPKHIVREIFKTIYRRYFGNVAHTQEGRQSRTAWCSTSACKCNSVSLRKSLETNVQHKAKILFRYEIINI